MAPDSIGTQITTIVVAVVLVVLTATLWERPRGWLAWVLRPLALTLCLLTALAAGGVAVNREVEVYTTWSALFGKAPGEAATPTDEQAPGDALQPVLDAPRSASGSRVVSFTVTGKASGITLQAFAYLPPGYDQEPLNGQRLPVIEALSGFPGSPQTWLKALEAPKILDEEITSGRMAPTVVVFPYQVLSNTHDTECVNEVNGIQMDTFLTTDVPEAVRRLFRVRTDPGGWGLIGYSAGAFCAVNLALRHPDKYSAAASLSGYFRAITDKTTGDLYKGNQDARNQNSPLWRVQNLPIPRVALYLAAAKDDTFEYKELEQFVAVTRSPLRVTTQSLPQGGHTRKVWKALEAPAFDWLSSWLSAPVPIS
ncbi:alpha/beta hydrolase [Micromonospora zhanjiangensis]|uniref:Alpha/beta hydrolase n=1 Tax=Micromonospora zhanjiangensis TaxID=1522057 RepID=A0ABV8KS88_9ACTN